MLYWVNGHCFPIEEIPIVFTQRGQGRSKFTAGDFLRAALLLWKLRLVRIGKTKWA